MTVFNSYSRNLRHQITAVVAFFPLKRSLHPGSHLQLFTNKWPPYHAEECNHLHNYWKQPGQFIYDGYLIQDGQLRRPCLLWGQLSLLLKGYRSLPTGLKRPVREIDHICLVLKLRMITAKLALPHTPTWPAQEQLFKTYYEMVQWITECARNIWLIREGNFCFSGNGCSMLN